MEHLKTENKEAFLFYMQRIKSELEKYKNDEYIRGFFPDYPKNVYPDK